MRHRNRLSTLALAASAALLLAGCSAGTAASQSTAGTLTIGMTAGDVPNLDTMRSGDQGYEGYRFVGFQLYDGLTRWDLTQGEILPEIVPGLAESWEQSEDKLSWTFHLRDGVEFHDGTPFNADAVVYMFDRVLNPEIPEYDVTLAAQSGTSLLGVKSYEKVDDLTVVIHTNGPWASLPTDMATMLVPSPTAVQKEGNDAFAKAPVGTGPFTFESVTRGQQLTLAANKDYWRGAPKLDKLILRPIPDAAARTAALQSGEVDWIEAPTPDDVPMLEDSGVVISQNSYPQAWSWALNTRSGPFADVRVRQAINYAIDRESMVENLLHGTADPALQIASKASTAYTEANDVFDFDPARAKDLLAEAGYADGFEMTVSYPTGGSGNMQPTPMNEQLRSDLAAVGIDVTLRPLEWATLLTDFLSGDMTGLDAINMSFVFVNDINWQQNFGTDGPTNIGGYSDPALDALLAQLNSTDDGPERTGLLQTIGKTVTEAAPWLAVVNDRNPRAMTSAVHGFVAPQSWFIDLTTVSVGE